MRTRMFAIAICLAGLGIAPMVAQQPGTPAPPRGGTPAPAPAPAAGKPAPPPAAKRQGQPVNVKIEFTLTDQRTGGAPVKRTLTIVVADAMGGSIRSQSDVFGIGGGGVPLNIDTTPELLADGKIRLGFSVQYDWPAPLENTEGRNPPRGTVMKTSMHETVALVLENGKPMVATQSADPIGDRQVTVEVKATILR